MLSHAPIDADVQTQVYETFSLLDGHSERAWRSALVHSRTSTGSITNANARVCNGAPSEITNACLSDLALSLRSDIYSVRQVFGQAVLRNLR